MAVMGKFGRDETLVFDGRTPDDSFGALVLGQAGGIEEDGASVIGDGRVAGMRPAHA